MTLIPPRALTQSVLMALFLLVPERAHAAPDAEALAACQRETDAAKRIEFCTKVIDDKTEIEDIQAEALLHRGLALASQDENSKAIADYTRAIALNPQYTALYQSRGEAYFRSGDAKAAIADFDAVLKMDAQNALALHSRAAVNLQVGDYDAALVDFVALLALDGTDADAFAGRGLVFEHKGDRVHAEADYRKALELEGVNEVAVAGLQRLAGSL
jgi:tetratricopeptide (TPR) repeat protein